MALSSASAPRITRAAVTSAPGGSRAGSMRLPIGAPAVGQWANDMGPLYILLALELGALVALRNYFRRHHGG